jgi:pSer/pThr/pTyr-binding forkhead associated (FHA) protein
MAGIVVTYKSRVVKHHTINPRSKSNVTIGRHPTNDIVINNRLVSAHHAQITQTKNGLQLIDLNSTNGTYVNNDKVVDYQLAHQDWITIGKHILIVDLYETLSLEATQQMLKAGFSSAADAESTMLIDWSEIQGQMQSIDYLYFISSERQDFELSGTMITIGKNTDADIVVSGFWSLLAGTPSAIIGKQDDDYFLDYVSGLIKPRINGIPIQSPTKLNHHDVISIGPLTMQLYRITQGA